MRWLWLLAISACVILPRSLEMPKNDATTVALLSGTLGHPLDNLARHPWFAVRKQGETSWTVYEVGGRGSEPDPFRGHRAYGDPILHAMWRGAEAERAAACIESIAPGIREEVESHYTFYPGPNSNTFGDRVLRACGLHAGLPSTAIGKDWRGVIGANVTSEGTGVQLETPLLGVKIGLKEGLEIHIMGLSVGFDLWPPAIILPLGPGRLGFADR